MIYLSLDIETTGLDDYNDQVLEVAAVINTDNKTPIESLPKYQSLIKHKKIHGDPFAIVMNSKIIEEAMDKGKSSLQVNDELIEFAKPYLNDKGKIVVAGKNIVGFDIPFLKWMGSPKLDDLKTDAFVIGRPKFVEIFHRRVLDPAILYVTKDDIVPPDLKTCLSRAGIDKSVDHRALGDACDVIRLLRYKGI